MVADPRSFAYEEARFTLSARGRALAGVALMIVIPTLLLILGFWLAWVGVPLVSPALMALLVGVPMAFGVWRSLTRLQHDGELIITPDQICLTDSRYGESAVARSKLTVGYASEDRRQLFVAWSGGAKVAVRFKEPLAEQALEAIFGESSVSFQVKRGGRFAALVATALFMLGCVAWGLGEVALVLGLPLAALTLIVRSTKNERVTIGADGVRTTRAFTPFSRITAVHRSARGLTFDCVGGPSLRLRTRYLSSREVAALAARVETMMQRYHNQSLSDYAALRRGERSLSDWKRELIRRTESPNGFREQSIERDELGQALADPTAPAEVRVGAAMALRSLDPKDETRRLHVAIATTADEPTRRALQAVVDDDLDEPVAGRACNMAR